MSAILSDPKINYAIGCLTLTGACQFSNLRQVSGDNFHALQCLGVSGVEMKFYERRLQALLFSSPPPAVASPLACLSRVYFSRYLPNGELPRRLTIMQSTNKLGQNQDSETCQNFLQIAHLLVGNGVSRHFYHESLKVTL